MELIQLDKKYILFSSLSCSFQQDRAEAQTDPGPAGPDPDVEKPRQRDQGGEAAAEQRRAEAAAAGRAECGVYDRAANPHQRHQGGWIGRNRRRWRRSRSRRRRLPALGEHNFILSLCYRRPKSSCPLSPLLWRGFSRRSRSWPIARGRRGRKVRRR